MVRKVGGEYEVVVSDDEAGDGRDGRNPADTSDREQNTFFFFPS